MNKRQQADDFPLRNHNIKKPRKRQGDDLTLKSESEKKDNRMAIFHFIHK